jgi:prolipoprotein diacylglyceryltransferase
LYCAKRFFMEFFRADNPALVFGLTIFHILSITGFIVAVIGLVLIARAK